MSDRDILAAVHAGPGYCGKNAYVSPVPATAAEWR
jgi:hypothetical protein